jgi:hypothetical protein
MTWDLVENTLGVLMKAVAATIGGPSFGRFLLATTAAARCRSLRECPSSYPALLSVLFFAQVWQIFGLSRR